MEDSERDERKDAEAEAGDGSHPDEDDAIGGNNEKDFPSIKVAMKREVVHYHFEQVRMFSSCLFCFCISEIVLELKGAGDGVVF